jgi:hypothetical protein
MEVLSGRLRLSSASESESRPNIRESIKNAIFHYYGISGKKHLCHNSGIWLISSANLERMEKAFKL